MNGLAVMRPCVTGLSATSHKVSHPAWSGSVYGRWKPAGRAVSASSLPRVGAATAMGVAPMAAIARAAAEAAHSLASFTILPPLVHVQADRQAAAGGRHGDHDGAAAKARAPPRRARARSRWRAGSKGSPGS